MAKNKNTRRVISATGDGKTVYRVANKHTAVIRVRFNDDDPKHFQTPSLELRVNPDGTWTLEQDHVNGFSEVASGTLDRKFPKQ